MHLPSYSEKPDNTSDLVDFSFSGDDNNSPSQNFTDDINNSFDNISSNNFDGFDENLDFSDIDDWLYEDDFEPVLAKAAPKEILDCNYYCTTSKQCCALR